MISSNNSNMLMFGRYNVYHVSLLTLAVATKRTGMFVVKT